VEGGSRKEAVAGGISQSLSLLCLMAKKFSAFGTSAPQRQNFRNDRIKERDFSACGLEMTGRGKARKAVNPLRRHRKGAASSPFVPCG